MTDSEPVSSKKRTVVFLLSFLAVIFIALALRTPQLDKRPMHGDEAVHAIKFADLLERGQYEYDPVEYHGPTLNYFTLIPAWLSSQRVLSQVDEYTLRIVPVFFGVALVALAALIPGAISRTRAIAAALLTAVSPSMVYYSRYYIQEMLLVFFGFALIVCGYRYLSEKKSGWAVMAGMFAGLMHATKETCVLPFAAAFLGLLVIALASRSNKTLRVDLKGVRKSHIIAAVITAAVVSILFFSSFFTYGQGVIDSIRTYSTYLGRATDDKSHVHSWDYYLGILTWCRYCDGPLWSEAPVLALAAVGLAGAFIRIKTLNRTFVRFIAVYTIALTAIYSLIEYKTPWCLLGFHQGILVLAGIGVVVLLTVLRPLVLRAVVVVAVLAIAAYLAHQAVLAGYTYDCDSRNPYVYAHPTREIFEIVDRVEAAAAAHEQGRDVPVQVICVEDDYWPLPWYLRSFKKVYWWSAVDNDKPSAPIIVCSPEMEAPLAHKHYELTAWQARQMYMYLFDDPYYLWLRPNVKLVGLVRRDLWLRMGQ